LQQEWQRLDDIDSLLTDRIAAKQQLATEAAVELRADGAFEVMLFDLA
jgi:hypothetical protein